MTTYQPEAPTTPAARPRRRRIHPLTVIIPIGTLLIGVAMGGAASAKPANGPASKPACLSALTKADEVHRLAGQGFTYTAEALNAAAAGDYAGSRAANRKMDAQQPVLKSAVTDYNELAAACRG